MLGNVWEWTVDTYDEKAYEKHKRDNPIMESGGASIRVLRGGSWSDSPAGVIRRKLIACRISIKSINY